MANRKYWEIFVDEFIPEMGVTLSSEQREEILDAIVGHAEMEYEATGNAVASANLYAHHEKELKDLKASLRFEEEKILCTTCRGKGTQTTYGGTFQSTSRCDECGGSGRVHPSKASLRSLGVR